MVDDNDVALHRPAVHLGNETGLKRTAFLAEAGVRTRIQLVPESACLRQGREFGAVAGMRGLLPGSDRAVVLDFLEPGKHGLIGQVVQLLLAEIIVAPLHVADIQLALAVREEGLLEERNVFIEKLLLQILRSGRNDDALAGTNHRQEIRQSLAGTGAGFDYEVPLLG